ncbi:hypothetical protein [Cytophaga aurantiaca]|uniref:hypothetical protein n=1 Tax=Cytophaga aurantiaca TaxID=29530 RepID=UPI000364BBEF|nr:hypothetical protein [Cytophaga aurantiaca]
MRIIFNVFLFILLSAQVFAQQNSIIGVWRTPPNFSVLTYTFDSSGHLSFTQRGCMSSYALSGTYKQHNDSIFIFYDTLTSFQQSLYRIKDRLLSPDTLIYINEHKIQIAPNFFMYNQDRDEQVCTITSNGLFSFKIKHFGDTFTIKQFTYNEWKTIDTIIPPNDEYINMVNYPLFLHSGTNKFAIYINNRTYSRYTFTDGIIIDANKPPVKIENKKVIKNTLSFSDTTIYEVQDRYGNKLLRGKGKTIDCKTLPAGKYVLEFDNRTTVFVKR